MRALTGTEVEPTLTMREARAGDRYLLCSDGLSDVVSEETIGDTLGSVESPSGCADRLIELALRSGGPDNVTVVVADVVDTEFGESRPILGGAAGGDGEAAYTPDPHRRPVGLPHCGRRRSRRRRLPFPTRHRSPRRRSAAAGCLHSRWSARSSSCSSLPAW